MIAYIYLGCVITSAILGGILGTIKFNIIIKPEMKKRLSNDISVTEMRLLEMKIANVKKQYRLSDEASLDEIATALKIQDAGIDSTIDERAIIIKNGDIFNVYHSKYVPQCDWKFDFAHECGHIINGSKLPANRPTGHNKEYEEQLADYTASAILMPFNKVKTQLEKSDFSSISGFGKLRALNRFCREYGVSQIVVLRRINEIRMLS